MKRAWDKINFYRTTPGVRHKKMGVLLSDITSARRLERLMDEVIELIGQPNDLSEMADIAAILFHHVQEQGCAMEQFENRIIEKLAERLEVPECCAKCGKPLSPTEIVYTRTNAGRISLCVLCYNEANQLRPPLDGGEEKNK